jgi:hypothetical protein
MLATVNGVILQNSVNDKGERIVRLADKETSGGEFRFKIVNGSQHPVLSKLELGDKVNVKAKLRGYVGHAAAMYMKANAPVDVQAEVPK